jgi:Protein of unknown function C-terminus (DUF2399)
VKAALPDRRARGGSEEESAHTCRYVRRLTWSDWYRSGALAERWARRIPICGICGRERPARRPRPPALREVRAEIPEAPPLADAAGRAVAAALVRHGRRPERPAPVRGLFADLARRGIPGSVTEEWIHRFVRAGWLTAAWKAGVVASLDGAVAGYASVTVRDADALRQVARPGEDASRRGALQEARERTAFLTHPKAAEIAAILGSPEAETFPPPLVQALAALAVHAEAGDVLAERIFSARHLGNSKALAGRRGRLERLVGPLAEIGIREGASLTLLGGEGCLVLEDRTLDLRFFDPFVGLAREVLERVEKIAFPADGLFVVENLAVFEACCRGEVEAARGALIAWSAGYPSRTFRRIVDLAAAAAAPLRIWADLDLDGVRIARLIASWHPSGAAFFRMSPEDLATAPRHRPLTARSLTAIRRNLEEQPEAPLAETLQAMLDSGRWVEQEAFLGADV